MKIAVEGCAHGELEKIYETLQGIENSQNIKVDLLICCGDFQSTRNLEDLQTMAVPKKYQDICTFYKYYSGELVAPVLTIFIGGNHEASNYLQELPYGGWVAPNIYYLGYAGVVRINGIRIAGLSGIYKGHDYLRGRHEFPPYTDSTCRSVYHVRQLEVFRLKQLSGKLDIFISHDWPRGIYKYGNKAQLLRFKPHFREEMENGQLGSRPCEDLLNLLKPHYWFSAHLHCKFSALVPHISADNSQYSNDAAESTDADDLCESFTKFLALDKCLPRRRFLQLLDIDSVEKVADANEPRFEYDLEWLTILNLTNHLINVKNGIHYMPGGNNSQNNSSQERCNFTPSAEELQQVNIKFSEDLRIPENFCRTVKAYDPNETAGQHRMQQISQPSAQINPQCTQFCEQLGIDDPLSLAMLIGGHELNYSSSLDCSGNTTLNDSSILQQSGGNEQSVLNSPQEKTTPLKRKSNFALKLPTPMQTREDTEAARNPDELLLDDEETVENPTIDSKQINIEKEEILTVESSKPILKKFRRRNHDLYVNKEEDEPISAEI